ncbi:uncharacterized protein LOC126746555 [Anthonomus grandis grandis]|uniref:uncharacterized protein LOC126746555 n=1 Tax=Anthonomus grandis grandis TaxID=2921223 RepID=UPI002165445B|nr:uncharacterized protein LOC126746555 [Anthonomus grandis grandis]
MSLKASQTGGVKPMSIEGRLKDERERLLGMTDAERNLRKQWLKDQILSENEPRVVPEIYKATYNPIRRFYRYPMDQVEKALTPVLGLEKAQVFRGVTAKFGFMIMGAYWTWYYMKYNRNNWERRGGIRVKSTREPTMPGDPGYPHVPNMKPQDYMPRGFDKVTLNL